MSAPVINVEPIPHRAGKGLTILITPTGNGWHRVAVVHPEQGVLDAQNHHGEEFAKLYAQGLAVGLGGAEILEVQP